MNEKYTLNILNGQSMHEYFKQHHFDEDGVYVPFNEAMCVGEVTYDIFSKEFNISRCSAHNVTIDQYNEITLKPLQILFAKAYFNLTLT